MGGSVNGPVDGSVDGSVDGVAGIFALVVNTVIVVVAAALAAGLVFLVVLHLRRIHHVLYRGDSPRVRPPGPEESAWWGYHGGPLWRDLAEVHRRVHLDAGPFVVFLAPFLLLQVMVALVHSAVAWTAVGVLRSVDGSLLLVRRIRMVCPRCFEHMSYPSYACEDCGRPHRDVRSGARGVFRRRCVCGRDLPTLLLLGSADLRTLCPHCDQVLEHRPGEAREFVLPLFGAAGAGKTRLTHGLHLALEYAAGRHVSARAVAMGRETVRRLRDSRPRLAPDHRVPPTPPGRRARGLTLRVEADRCALLVQLYDTAGEWFNTTERTEDLTYLGEATTFLLVLDPLAVPAVWNALTADEQHRLHGDRSRVSDPERAYMQVRDQVQRRYRGPGVGRPRTRLAVVVTRGDLLARTSLDPSGLPPERWVREVMGANNLLRAARADFGTVATFVTSAVVDPDGRPDPSLAELLRWVLAYEAAPIGAMLTDTRRTPVPTAAPMEV
ncbi:hypothetical protein [Nocardiopsis sp. JB363]|uniref:TRAFAC clade GTPase domain-containing protein n=1 Tax=Nocardiopsis sp. JB363 TaxID=1434837 RepID=UPI000B35CA89|nr:hypothetical protein [Nocardiopsis sp. JB363]